MCAVHSVCALLLIMSIVKKQSTIMIFVFLQLYIQSQFFEEMDDMDADVNHNFKSENVNVLGH